MTWYYDGEEVPYEPSIAHEWNKLWWFICEVYGSPADALQCLIVDPNVRQLPSLAEALAFAFASRSSGIDLEDILNEVGHFIQENTILPDDDTMRRSHRNSWKIAGLTFTWVDTAKTISASTKLGKLFKRPATGKAPRDRRYR